MVRWSWLEPADASAPRPLLFAVCFYCKCSIILLQCFRFNLSYAAGCSFFYVNRKARVYVRQLAQTLEADSTNLSRELARLEQEGLLRAEPEGRQLYYSVNPSSPLLKPLSRCCRAPSASCPR